MHTKFSIIREKDIRQFIDAHHAKLFDLIKSTYLLHEENKTINPNSYFLRFPDKHNARIIALPAAISAENKVSGIKWISSYPDNFKKYNRPRASAVIILNDYETGIPIACLEGSAISAARTALSAALAAQYMNAHTRYVKNIGLIGNGPIAKTILKILIKQGWECDQINLYDLNQDAMRAAQIELQSVFKGPIKMYDYQEDVITRSDLIIFATTSVRPYIDDPALFLHLPIILHISLRDLSPEIIYNANNIVDNVEHVLSAATSLDLTAQYFQTKNFLTGTLGQLMQGDVAFDQNKPRIFSPMGMGILDLAVANFIYQHIENNKKLQLDDFYLN